MFDTFFYLSFTRLAGFASFYVKMSVQKSFCGRILIHELTWFWCSTMLHKDVTTWLSLYDSVKHHFDGFKLRTRYNYMRKPTHTFTRKNFICGDFHEKSTDATTKALFFRVNLILFYQTFHDLIFSPRHILLVYYSKDDLYKASYNSFSVVVKQSTSQFSFNMTCLTREPKTNYFLHFTLLCCRSAGGRLRK